MKTVRMMKTPMKNPKAEAVSSQSKMIRFHTDFLKDKSQAQISKALQSKLQISFQDQASDNRLFMSLDSSLAARVPRLECLLSNK